MPDLPDPDTVPCSPFDETGGLAYFPRMLAKIRLHAAGRLWADLHANLGKGMDLWCCGYLQVTYDEVKEQVLKGATDDEVLRWCEQRGQPLNDITRHVWRQFLHKVGMNDAASGRLAKWKAESGLADRDDIVTMGHYMDVAEGRKP